MNKAMEKFQEEKDKLFAFFGSTYDLSCIDFYTWLDLLDALEETRFPKLECIDLQFWDAIYWTKEEMQFHNDGLPPI